MIDKLASNVAEVKTRGASVLAVASEDDPRITEYADETIFLPALDWRLQRAFALGGQWRIVPSVEMFNTFNNANNVNPLATPALFNFDGFLRQGVGDPRQVQLAVKVTF